jgi:multidrug efflux system membrane fusion protein
MRRTASTQAPAGLFFGPFRFCATAGGLGAVALFLAACTPAAPPPEPVRAVKLLTVGVGALQAQQEYSGEVRARTESRLGFRVAGKIVQRQAELGQRVRAGQVLAQLDPQDYQLAAQAAAQAQVWPRKRSTIWRRPTSSALRR